MNKTATLKFIAFAYLLGFALQSAFWKNPDQSFWLIFAMWTPTIAVLLTGRYALTEIAQDIRKISLSMFIPAFFIGLLPYVVVQICILFFGLGQFDETQDLHRIPFVLLLNPIATGLLGALGEEIGWRGFLQPELQKRFKPTHAILLVGIIWAFWHLPANLGGHNGVEHRILNTFIIFPITVVGMSFAFGWLRIRSKSIWPCVYFHGVINSISNYWLIKPNIELTEKVVGLIAWTIIGVFFIMKLKKIETASEQ